MERNYKLYVHICPNEKRYYGITKLKPERRWRSGSGYRNNKYFTSAIEKYGWDNITHEILFDGLTESEAKELEQYYIQWYDTANRDYGYNISLGGEGGYGCKRSEETRQKLSEALKGKNLSEEHKQKLSEARLGKHHSEETKQKMSEVQKGKHHSEEAKQKMSESHKGKQHTEEVKQKLSEINKGKNNPNAKSVICITTKKMFLAAADASRCYDIAKSNITKCCQGKRKSAGKLPDGTKLVWRYLNHNHNKTYRVTTSFENESNEVVLLESYHKVC